MSEPVMIEGPNYEALAQRSQEAAETLESILPNRLPCAAIYLSSDHDKAGDEVHRLLVVTSGTLELFEAKVDAASWIDSNGRLTLRRRSLSKDHVALPLRYLTKVEVHEDGQAWDGQRSEPQPERTYTVHLSEPLGSLGEHFELPFRQGDTYQGQSLPTPQQDAEGIVSALLEHLRR